MTTHQKKSVRFVWSQQCQDSFDKLKQLLKTTPIFRIFNPNKDLLVSQMPVKMVWKGF